ncbi:MAG: cytidylate kinase-like family protein [Pseudomonadota bacterium]
MMRKSHEKIIDEQVKRWEIMRAQKTGKEEGIPVITVSREPGSGGGIVAKKVAEQLGLDLFHGEIIQKIAESADTSSRILETLDEKGLSVLDDWISTLVNRRHLWPDQYLKHLMRVIGTIGKHGRAVIVGRGANFILPREVRFRVRIVAPLDTRVQNVAREFGVSSEEARRRVLRTESDRRAFGRKYFHADITDPVNYDLVINTGTLSIDAAVEAIKGGLGR